VFWIRYEKQGREPPGGKLITVAEGDPSFDQVPDLD
jgi:hypothetical protein